MDYQYHYFSVNPLKIRILYYTRILIIVTLRQNNHIITDIKYLEGALCEKEISFAIICYNFIKKQ